MTGLPVHALSSDAHLRRREAAENFPVAMRVLPRQARRHLRAVYDVVRVIDDLGDEASGDRVALLEDFRADLSRVWRDGRPLTPVLARLVPTVRACALAEEPFARLVAANLADQRIASYPTYADLRGYCALSADPIGRLVLAVFGVDSPGALELSDRICTGLQLLEHWQDVAEDRRAGRVYLPAEDLAAHGVRPADLDRSRSTPALRRLIAFETRRAADLLRAGAPLVGQCRGWARVAVAGYLAGGLATVDALARPDTDVLVRVPRPRRVAVARHALGAMLTPPPRPLRRRVS
jgi:squalene synthase HpnC